jgi:hypothetical protein
MFKTQSRSGFVNQMDEMKDQVPAILPNGSPARLDAGEVVLPKEFVHEIGVRALKKAVAAVTGKEFGAEMKEPLPGQAGLVPGMAGGGVINLPGPTVRTGPGAGWEALQREAELQRQAEMARQARLAQMAASHNAGVEVRAAEAARFKPMAPYNTPSIEQGKGLVPRAAPGGMVPSGEVVRAPDPRVITGEDVRNNWNKWSKGQGTAAQGGVAQEQAAARAAAQSAFEAEKAAAVKAASPLSRVGKFAMNPLVTGAVLAVSPNENIATQDQENRHQWVNAFEQRPPGTLADLTRNPEDRPEAMAKHSYLAPGETVEDQTQKYGALLGPGQTLYRGFNPAEKKPGYSGVTFAGGKGAGPRQASTLGMNEDVKLKGQQVDGLTLGSKQLPNTQFATDAVVQRTAGGRAAAQGQIRAQEAAAIREWAASPEVGREGGPTIFRDGVTRSGGWDVKAPRPDWVSDRLGLNRVGESDTDKLTRLVGVKELAKPAMSMAEQIQLARLGLDQDKAGAEEARAKRKMYDDEAKVAMEETAGLGGLSTATVRNLMQQYYKMTGGNVTPTMFATALQTAMTPEVVAGFSSKYKPAPGRPSAMEVLQQRLNESLGLGAAGGAQ